MIYDALKRAGHSLELAPAPPSPAVPSPAPEPAPAITPLPRAAAKRRASWPEMAGLFYNIAAQRSSDGPVVLQFLASRPGEGASAIAREFAAFAASDDTSPVLLVDCSCRGAVPHPARPPLGHAPGPSLADAARAGEAIGTAIEPGRNPAHLHRARLADQPNSLLHTNAVAWAALLDQARQLYRFTVLDCPAVSTHPDSVVLARSCDGVVIVVEAETTRGPVVRATIETVERFGGRVLGLAFNKRRFYIPRWIYRRL
jgi:Mrp family chromosome partitioning ATPase